ncbi:SIR2 family protein [Ralstonia holmesii]|nr:hypothetical protein R11007_00877 [Ralstonia sp. LMG 32967]
MLSKIDLDLLRQGLFSGQYNLLLGSGVSLDSKDRFGSDLKSATELTKGLCKLKGVSDTTSLSRVSLLLEPSEVDKHLTQPYLGCKPGETVKRITSYVWRNIFTFNIDDALESAYEATERPKQKVESLNYDSLFKTQPNKGYLSLIHLHGFTREPEKGYVFSTTEYGRATRGMSAWMHVLAELMASEPFIIAGTSLNESDLEYYLAGRTEASARTNRGPSFLVEPYPDKVTELVCKQHGLTLVKAKLSEFLAWLASELGAPPLVSQLTIPSLDGVFLKKPSPEDQINFFSSFELVKPAVQNSEGEVSPFYFGKCPRWSDFESSLDVPTDDERAIGARVRNWLNSDTSKVKIVNVNCDPGSGKTTTIRRIGYDLSKDGFAVLCLGVNSVFDYENSARVLSLINRPAVLIIDGLADHSPSVRSLLATLNPPKPIVILSADRDYRRDHIDRLIGDFDIEYCSIGGWSADLYERLIEKLRRAGLLGASDAVRYPRKFASQLARDPVAIATCRALNNFKPLEAILRSLWNDAKESDRRSYAIAALAEHCYAGGIFHPILENSFHNSGLSNQLKMDCPLPLAYADDGDYVLPLNPVIADRLLHMLSREKQSLLLEIFSMLANALSPYVNRRATIDRTPEAKLAARLFSAEQVARPLLGTHADAFFSQAREAWQWNSRYWEQRALLTQSNNIDVAIQYARHAVAIEEHPFPWTTLASLLTKKLEVSNVGAEALYSEIYDVLAKVIKYETTNRTWRPTPHPYSTLFSATIFVVNKNGKISPKRRDWILQQVDFCNRVFSRDSILIEAANKVSEIIKSE